MASFFVPAADRRTIRRAVRLDCQVVRERDFRLVGRKALDLSTEGILVAAEDDVEPGEPLIVSFRAPWSPHWIDGEGTVARLVHGRRPEDKGRHSIGVRFRPMEDESTSILRQSLLQMPLLPAPRRPTRIDYAATVRRIAFGDLRALRRTKTL